MNLSTTGGPLSLTLSFSLSHTHTHTHTHTRYNRLTFSKQKDTKLYLMTPSRFEDNISAGPSEKLKIGCHSSASSSLPICRFKGNCF